MWLAGTRWTLLVVDVDSMLSLECSEYEPGNDWLCESNEETRPRQATVGEASPLSVTRTGPLLRGRAMKSSNFK